MSPLNSLLSSQEGLMDSSLQLSQKALTGLSPSSQTGLERSSHLPAYEVQVSFLPMLLVIFIFTSPVRLTPVLTGFRVIRAAQTYQLTVFTDRLFVILTHP